MHAGATITACTLRDIDDLSAVGEHTFRETFQALNTAENMDAYVRTAYARDALAAELDTPGTGFFLLRVSGVVAGYLKINVGAAQTDDVGPDGLQVERIYVLAAHQREGLGQFMLDYACRLARLRSLGTIWLGVWEHNNSAMAFYAHLGFVQFGAHDFMLGDDRQTDLLMRRPVPAGSLAPVSAVPASPVSVSSRD